MFSVLICFNQLTQWTPCQWFCFLPYYITLLYIRPSLLLIPRSEYARKPRNCVFISTTKTKVPLLSKSQVVYKFSCLGCQSSYIGKTDRTLSTRTHEHAVTDKESALYKRLRTCKHLTFIHNLFNLPDTLNNITTPTISGNNERAINVVQNNTTVLDYEGNWNLLLYKEAFLIKRQSPSRNKGLKSSRELCLFSWVYLVWLFKLLILYAFSVWWWYSLYRNITVTWDLGFVHLLSKFKDTMNLLGVWFI